MGMSHDFEVAIEEGATLVRVGTAIFGADPSLFAEPPAADTGQPGDGVLTPCSTSGPVSSPNRVAAR